MNLDFWKDVVIDTGIDALRIFPFLLLTYILMEYMEHHAGNKMQKSLENAGSFGPLIGAVSGIVPQCGFSAAASNLYAARVISMGSLIAVYLSTSDEMLPLMISSKVAPATIIKILATKAVIGLVAGVMIDLVARLTGPTPEVLLRQAEQKARARARHAKAKKKNHGHGRDHGHSHERKVAQSHHEHEHSQIHELCEREHCDCDKDGIFVSALKHSLKVLVFVMIISFAINVFMQYIGKAGIQYVTIGQSYGVIVLASLVGLIPNCGVSVALTELYTGGMIGEGALMSGLLVGAGVGLLVLLRVNRPVLNTIKVTALLWGIGILAGCLIKILGITFI